jgi:transposase-like protein
MASDSRGSAAGSARRERRHFSAQQKVALVKRHLLDGVTVSDLCDEARITPTQFYQWQKQLFEGGAAAFEKRPGKPAGPSPVERRIAHLELKLATKNEVIAELTEENVRLKKVDGLP